MNDYRDIKRIVGKKVHAIYINDDFLKFETDQGDVCYVVEGDCCSSSMFYDLYGVKKLLENGAVLAINSVDLEPNDIVESDWGVRDRRSSDSDIQVYGYELVTEHPKYGKQTSVLSFRNYSNGYYGGWMEAIDSIPEDQQLIKIEDDWIGE